MLVVAQEMVVRLGAVTGVGHARLIRATAITTRRVLLPLSGDDGGVEASYEWLERGGHLLTRGAWLEARQVFADALAQVGGTPAEGPAAEGLAGAAWELDACQGVPVLHEQAYCCYRSAGDERAAGRMATWLALDAIHLRGEVAVAQGWFERAHRLLAELPDGVEHAMLALFEGMVALRVDRDTGRAVECADKAVALGAQLGSPDLEVQGRALRGLALVGQGRVSEGMRLLDEASASALAGDLQELSSVWVPCCYMMWGYEQVRDWDRAGAWCQRVLAVDLDGVRTSRAERHVRNLSLTSAPAPIIAVRSAVRAVREPAMQPSRGPTANRVNPIGRQREMNAGQERDPSARR